MPSLEVAIGGIIVVSLIWYVLFGVADFGAGAWYLLERGPSRAEARHQIEHAIGPIWEANHVWLILVVTLLFTAFPPAFARIMTVLHIPLVVLLLAIVGRGSAFAFRSHDVRADPTHGVWDWLFAASSTLAPLLLGIVLGAITGGHVYERHGTFVDVFVWSWLTPFSLLVGCLALAVGLWLSAVYLWVEAQPSLASHFRRRALTAAVVTHAIAALLLLMTVGQRPLWATFIRSVWGSLLLVGTGLAGTAMFLSIIRRQPRKTRLLAATEVTFMVIGWALAQYPHLVPPDLTLYNSAAPVSTLTFLLGALIAGAVILFPSLYVLYRIFKGGPMALDRTS